MVKNTKGGSKAKKFGRKFQNTGGSNALRYSSEEAEIYACCAKIYGGPNIEVKCVDGYDRLCIMRNKFRGRGKRDNVISVGTWLLVGLREFETVKEGKKQTCDLLEVYRDSDKAKLQQHEVSVEWKILKEIKNTSENFEEDDDEDDLFEFTDKNTNEIEDLIRNKSTTMIKAIDDDEEDVDVDDI
jgi:translation initiation factor IF-1